MIVIDMFLWCALALTSIFCVFRALEWFDSKRDYKRVQSNPCTEMLSHNERLIEGFRQQLANDTRVAAWTACWEAQTDVES